MHPYRDVQYRTLARTVAGLMASYPALTRERITSHARIAPLRKTDPGPAFDWAYFDRLLDDIQD